MSQIKFVSNDIKIKIINPDYRIKWEYKNIFKRLYSYSLKTIITDCNIKFDGRNAGEFYNNLDLPLFILNDSNENKELLQQIIRELIYSSIYYTYDVSNVNAKLQFLSSLFNYLISKQNDNINLSDLILHNNLEIYFSTHICKVLISGNQVYILSCNKILRGELEKLNINSKLTKQLATLSSYVNEDDSDIEMLENELKSIFIIESNNILQFYYLIIAELNAETQYNTNLNKTSEKIISPINYFLFNSLDILVTNFAFPGLTINSMQFKIINNNQHNNSLNSSSDLSVEITNNATKIILPSNTNLLESAMKKFANLDRMTIFIITKQLDDKLLDKIKIINKTLNNITKHINHKHSIDTFKYCIHELHKYFSIEQTLKLTSNKIILNNTDTNYSNALENKSINYNNTMEVDEIRKYNTDDHNNNYEESTNDVNATPMIKLPRKSLTEKKKLLKIGKTNQKEIIISHKEKEQMYLDILKSKATYKFIDKNLLFIGSNRKKYSNYGVPFSIILNFLNITPNYIDNFLESTYNNPVLDKELQNIDLIVLSDYIHEDFKDWMIINFPEYNYGNNADIDLQKLLELIKKLFKIRTEEEFINKVRTMQWFIDCLNLLGSPIYSSKLKTKHISTWLIDEPTGSIYLSDLHLYTTAKAFIKAAQEVYIYPFIWPDTNWLTNNQINNKISLLMPSVNICSKFLASSTYNIIYDIDYICSLPKGSRVIFPMPKGIIEGFDNSNIRDYISNNHLQKLLEYLYNKYIQITTRLKTYTHETSKYISYTFVAYLWAEECYVNGKLTEPESFEVVPIATNNFWKFVNNELHN